MDRHNRLIGLSILSVLIILSAISIRTIPQHLEERRNDERMQSLERAKQIVDANRKRALEIEKEFSD